MYRTFFKSQSSLTPLPAILRCPAPSSADKAALPLAGRCANSRSLYPPPAALAGVAPLSQKVTLGSPARL